MSNMLKIRTPKKEVIELEVSENPYFRLDQRMFTELCNVIYEHHKYACQVISHSQKHIYNWIESALPLLSDQCYTVATKVFWIIHGIANWDDLRVRCKRKECKKPLIHKNVISLFQGYHLYCSCRCSAQAEETRQKYVETSNLQFGADNWMKVKSNVDILQDRFEKKYGIGKRSPMQVPEFKATFESSMLSTHGGRYTFECADLMQKVNETNLKNFGTTHPAQTKECKKKTKESFRKHYGVDHNMKCDFGKSEMYEGLKKAYGLPANAEIHSPAQIPQVAEKISMSLRSMPPEKKAQKLQQYEQTCYDAYGVRNTLLLPETKQAFIGKYGVSYPMQSEEIRKSMCRKYEYGGIMFDSAPELAFYVWLSDQKVHFTYQPEDHFEYEYDGEAFNYFPDFKLNDELIEIKGDHFFNESGQMICPFRKKEWSDEEYDRVCRKYEAKHQCMLKNNVKIMRSAEYQKYVQYIKDKFGKEFFETHRR